MNNFFDKSVHYLGKTNPNTFIMNIGAMDGVMFDELIGYTNMYNFKGLYVEPIPYLFDKLKNNIPNEGNMFENSAISDYNGEIEMMTIDRDVIDQGIVHSCFYGMSAVYPPKNGLGSEFDRPTVEKYGQKVNVKCITFDKLLRKHRIENFDIIKIDAEGHDYVIFKQIDFLEFRPKVVRLEWINLNEEEKQLIKDKFDEVNYKFEINGQDIVGIPEEFYNELINNESDNINLDVVINTIKPTKKKGLTLVTGLWNISRDTLENGWSRSYQHYLDKFLQLLDVEENLIIFGDEELKKFVFEKRNESNTQFIVRDISWFKNSDYFNVIQKIRNNPEWYNQVGWLSESTQAKLEMYNPLVMSKMFLLHDAKILDKFDSDYLFWIDAGITNTVHPGYFTHDKVLEKLPKYINNFHFVCFPYETNSEIHGFKYDGMLKYSESDIVNKVARGGFFGGKKDSISEINTIYYGLMIDTLNNGYMGTEESLFTIITYKYPELITYSEIDGNGLMGKFFEDLKNDTVEVKSETKKIQIPHIPDNIDEGLYILKSNNPNQLESLIRILTEHNPEILNTSETYFLNKSNDTSKDETYKKICNINNITYSSVNDSPIVNNFFEDLKKERIRVLTEKLNKVNQVSLYVIGFNSPNQFSTLIKSMIEYDEDFIKKPKKYLLNNSTDRSTDAAYEEICAMYDFEIINPGENLGICGGRQFVAEHFDKTDAQFYWFFEDDMFFYPKKGEVCKNGFNRYVSNLYDKSMRIIQTENFDFLKMNFTEFFGDNSTQFSWYNVPQHVREEFWPEKQKLPQMGLDPNAPRTVFKNIKSLDGVPYADGEIYYCNWVQVVSRKGNQKMFLETKWAHAYEQTWMSFMYQETKKGNLNGGLLLMTPTEHNRFEHYAANLRKES